MQCSSATLVDKENNNRLGKDKGRERWEKEGMRDKEKTAVADGWCTLVVPSMMRQELR